MRLSPLAAALPVLAAVVLTMTGCAAPPPVETPASPSAEPVPDPTVEPIVIGPAVMPPVAFGGHCAKALTIEDLFDVTGIEFAPEDTVDDPLTSKVVANVGGLECSWVSGDGRVYLDTIPQAGLDGARFPHVEDYFEDCDRLAPGCAWYQ
ncbi:MAG: hypothetical protein ACRCSL_11305, partial [Microbacterium sp.]